MTTHHGTQRRVLTPPAVKAFKAKPAAYYVRDLLVPGLELRISPTGGKTWSLRYRNHHGQQKRVTFDGDAIRVLPLAQARAIAKNKRREIANGKDPAAEKVDARAAVTIQTFAETYIKHVEAHKRSWKTDRRYLQREVVRKWKSRLVRDIEQDDVVKLLDGIADRGAPIVANRVRATLLAFFKFAKAKVKGVTINPVRDTVKAGAEHVRERVYTDDELRAFWQATETLPATMRAAYRLVLLTAARPGEVRDMKWADLDFVAKTWTLPASATKSKRPHLVPLNSTVLAILSALPKLDDTFVLALARGKRQRAQAAARIPIDDFHAHDLRRTCATRLQAAGVTMEVIAALLNHGPKNVTEQHYALHKYLPEKTAALTWWGTALDAILANEPAKILPFAARA